jgi:hypothetical protein
MKLTLLATLVISAMVIGVGFASYLGWRDLRRWHLDPGEPLWRKLAALMALLLVSLSLFGWLGYGMHNAIIGGIRVEAHGRLR